MPNQTGGIGVVQERDCDKIEEDDSRFISMPDKWMPKKRKTGRLIGMIQSTTTSESADLLLVAGEEDVGKSCLLKKVAAYLLSRKQHSKRQFQQWLYLDMKDMRSVLQVFLSCQIIREGHQFHGLDQVLNWVKGIRSLVVLDHCDKVAYGGRFEFLLAHIRRSLTEDSKVILLMRTSSQGSEESFQCAAKKLQKELEGLKQFELKRFLTDHNSPHLQDKYWLKRVEAIEQSFNFKRKDKSWNFNMQSFAQPSDQIWKNRFDNITQEQWKTVIPQLRDQLIRSKLDSLTEQYKRWRMSDLGNEYAYRQRSKHTETKEEPKERESRAMERLRNRLNIPEAKTFELFKQQEIVETALPKKGDEIGISIRLRKAMSLLSEPHTSKTISLIGELLEVKQINFHEIEAFELVDEDTDLWCLKDRYRLSAEDLEDADIFNIVKLLQLYALKYEITGEKEFEEPFELWPLSESTVDWNLKHQALQRIERQSIDNLTLRHEMIRELFNHRSSSKFRLDCLGTVSLSIFTNPEQQKYFTRWLISRYRSLKWKNSEIALSGELQILIGELEVFEYQDDHERLFDIYQAAYQLFQIRVEEQAPIRLELTILKNQLKVPSSSNKLSLRMDYAESCLDFLVQHLLAAAERTKPQWVSNLQVIKHSEDSFSRLKEDAEQYTLRHYSSLVCALAEWLEYSPIGPEYIETVGDLFTILEKAKEHLPRTQEQDGFRLRFWYSLNFYKCKLRYGFLIGSSVAYYETLLREFQEVMGKSLYHQAAGQFHLTLKEHIRKARGCLIKVLTSEPFLRQQSKNGRYQSWTERWIEKMYKESGKAKTKFSKAYIEWGVLSEASFEQALKEECLMLLIRADFNKGKMHFDNYVEEGSVQNPQFKNCKCKILFLCGKEIPKYQPIYGVDTIILNVKYHEKEIKGNEYRSFLQNQFARLYLEWFTYQFVKDLLTQPKSLKNCKRAFILAQHVTNCLISEMFAAANMNDELQRHKNEGSISGIYLDNILDVQYLPGEQEGFKLELESGQIVENRELGTRLNLLTKVWTLAELARKVEDFKDQSQYFLCIGNKRTKTENVLLSLLSSIKEGETRLRSEEWEANARLADATKGTLSKRDQTRMYSAVTDGCQVFYLPYERGDDYSGNLDWAGFPEQSTIRRAGQALKRLQENQSFYTKLQIKERKDESAPATWNTPSATIPKQPKGPLTSSIIM